MIKPIEDEAQEVAEAINRKHHADWDEFGMQQAYIAGANRDGWINIVEGDASTLPTNQHEVLLFWGFDELHLGFYVPHKDIWISSIFDCASDEYINTEVKPDFWQLLPKAPTI